MKEKQKSDLRVSRRYIEVERERDSFRSGQLKKCVAVSVGAVVCYSQCLARRAYRGSDPRHRCAQHSLESCATEAPLTDSEPRLWGPSTVADLFGRCGVGSRRERVRVRVRVIER